MISEAVSQWILRCARRAFAISQRFRKPGPPPRPASGCSWVGFSIPKIGEPEVDNADSYFIGDSLLRFVVADGVSNSYAPEKWSQLLTPNVLVRDFDNGLSEAVEALSRQLDLPDVDAVPWNVAALMAKGSHSTLLIAELEQIESHFCLKLRSIGDCVAMLEFIGNDGQKAKVFWPFESTGEFPIAPSTLSSIEPFVNGNVAQLEIEGRWLQRLVLATDAVGRWIISEQGLPTEWGASARHNRPVTADEFKIWVNSCRRDGSMEDDDSTLLIIDWK